jgi:hypothetical protein
MTIPSCVVVAELFFIVPIFMSGAGATHLTAATTGTQRYQWVSPFRSRRRWLVRAFDGDRHINRMAGGPAVWKFKEALAINIIDGVENKGGGDMKSNHRVPNKSGDKPTIASAVLCLCERHGWRSNDADALNHHVIRW